MTTHLCVDCGVVHSNILPMPCTRTVKLIDDQFCSTTEATTMIGYTNDGEKTWWQAVYRHLKSVEAAAANAMAHNTDDPIEVFQLQATIEAALKQARSICDKKGVSCEE